MLRNALLPTITRDRHADRLSDRRPGRGRDAVPLPGHRRPDLHRRARQGFPDAAGGRAHHRRRLHAGRPSSPICSTPSQPAHPSGSRRYEHRADRRSAARSRPSRAQRAGPKAADAGASPTFLVGLAIVLFWVVCALFGSPFRALRPLRRRPPELAGAAIGRALVRHRPARPRRVLARHRRRARHPDRRAAGHAARHRRRHARSACVMGYFGGCGRRGGQPAHRRLPRAPAGHRGAAGPGRRSAPPTSTVIVVIGLSFTPIVARTVRAAVLAERELDYVAAAELRAREHRSTSCSSRSCPTCCRRSWSRRRCGSATPSSPSRRLSFIGFGIQPPSPDWGLTHLQQLRPDRRRLLVDGAVRRAGHRLARGRRQSDRRRHAGRAPMSEAAQRLRVRRPGRRLPRAPPRPAPCCVRSTSPSRRARPTGWSASRAAASRRWRWPSCAICRATAASPAAGSLVDGARRLATRPRPSCAALRATGVSMVYQDPGKALNPSLTIGRQVAEVFELAGARSRRGPGPRGGHAASACASPTRRASWSAIRTSSRAACSSASASPWRWPSDPALLILDEPTTGLDATVEAEVLDLVAAAAPRDRRPRSCSSATISRWSPRCATASACSMPGRWSRKAPTRAGLPRAAPSLHGRPCCAACRGAGQRKDERPLDTIPGFLPLPGEAIRGCVFAPRCALADDLCRGTPPPFAELGRATVSRCHYHDRAPSLPRATPARRRTTASAIDRTAAPVLRRRRL